MTKDQIVRFIHKVEPNVTVKFYRGKNHKYRKFGGWYSSGNTTVYINERVIFQGDKLQRSYKFITALLMHELGHHNTHAPGIVESEYKAQIWAINHAKKLGMTRISENLKYFMRNWTIDYYVHKMNCQGIGWNSCYRRYYLANKLAKKRRII